MSGLRGSAAALAVLVLVGCEKPLTQQPALSFKASPTTISDKGDETDLRLEALDERGEPGKGEVVLEAPIGRFANGESTIKVRLDSAGVGLTTYRCSVYEDDACSKGVTLTATWKGSINKRTLSQELDLTITGCGPVVSTQAPIVRQCAPRVDNECDGQADLALTSQGVPASRHNGMSGNGYDDDCDGLADEGCPCPQAGTTKDCLLVPPTQTDATTGQPVGWCSKAAKGSVDCAGDGDTNVWTGVCRGAQQPATTDSCAQGDFDCDGVSGNNRLDGCRCRTVPVICPQDVLTLAPYPDPTALTIVDGTAWIQDDAAKDQVTNWRWTAIGGDCDNVLPNPTFALYRTADTRDAGVVGSRIAVKLDTAQVPPRLVADTRSGIRGVQASTGAGRGGGFIYPAFGLSGDYLVQGSFDFEGVTYSCTQKVQVRSPGLRVELCWTMDGGSRDIDLHVARLQGMSCDPYMSLDGGGGAGGEGWNDICGGMGGQTCDWTNTRPNWNYATSPASACTGWSSKGSASGGGCNNPRLDKDNVSCNGAVNNPTANDFCGPENINIDNPRDGDRFAIMANYFGGGQPTKVHSNVYCNGERVASVGFNPATGTNAPTLLKSGGDSTGDMWTVGTVTARVNPQGTITGCAFESVPSRRPSRDRDGTAAYCVDTTVDGGYRTHHFVEDGTGQGLPAGSQPQTRGQWCKH